MIDNQLYCVYCSIISVCHCNGGALQHLEMSFGGLPPTKTSVICVFIITWTTSVICSFIRYTLHLPQGKREPLFRDVLWAHPPTGTRQTHSSFHCLVLASQFCCGKFAYFSSTQWRTQGGGQGAMAPPKPESQGAKLSFGPPHSRYIRFFFFKYT